MHPFEIAAEPVRRRILEVLATGRHPVGVLNDVIAAEFAVSRSAVWHHLRILRDAGAVSVLPDSVERLYGLEEDFLERLDHAVGELFHLWDHRYGFDSGRAPITPVVPSRTPHAEHAAGAEPADPAEPADRADRADRAEPAEPDEGAELAVRVHRAGRKGRRGAGRGEQYSDWGTSSV